MAACTANLEESRKRGAADNVGGVFVSGLSQSFDVRPQSGENLCKEAVLGGTVRC